MSPNKYLEEFSRKLYISHSDIEREYIKTLLSNFQKKLDAFFGNSIAKAEYFGSYTRGTMLPRKYDNNSDVDILIIFNTKDVEYTPITYRKKLHEFATKMYSTSSVVKDHPSIVIELSNVIFDLVPCVIKVEWGIFQNHYIPDSGNEWLYTDPYDFNTKITEANTKYNSIVKPIVRLIKRWNAANGYPYSPFDLEQEVVNFNFSGDNYISGFIYACNNLSTNDYYPVKKNDRIESLHYKISKVEDYIDNNNYDSSIKMLKSIFVVV